MKKNCDILCLVLKAGEKKRLYLPHALRQMIRPDRVISTVEIRAVIEHGELIEDYPEDSRGHSCLISGKGVGGRLSMLCARRRMITLQL